MSDHNPKRAILIIFAFLLALVSSVLLLAAVSPAPLLPTTPVPESNPSHPASPAMITWTPSSTEAIVSPGKMLTISIGFISSKNVRLASVHVSPQLAVTVNVEPASFERIRRGERKTLNLIIAPSTGSTLGTITGSIQLQRGKVEEADSYADEDNRRDQGKLLPQALNVIIHVAGVGAAIILPPDPGEPGKTTLQGIDSDGDGVRDDIQRYIGLTYSQSAKERAALTQTALALEAQLTGTSAHTQQLDNAMDCLSSALMTSDADVVGGKIALDVLLSLQAVVLNTPARANALFQADSKLGSTVSFSTPYAQKASRCLIDPSLFPN
jgi:hypothetical protein